MDERPVLVTGSTGYVGGRLVPRLLSAGHRVRALGRSLDKLRCRPWADHPLVELVQGDVLDLESLKRAATGCRAAFYLVHSMAGAKKDYAAKDRRAARNMVEAAAAGGVERIIYLGGLGNEREGLSEHLKSRTEVGRILAEGPARLTFLRAAMILGSGSASFELLRYLTDRLPIMITPRWVHSRVQPIAVTNVLGYLIGCLENEATAGRVLDIGGPEVVTYAQLFQIYAREAGLRRRLILPVPVFSPKLSSYWIHLVTPVPAGLAQPLAAGLKNTVVVTDNAIRDLVPQKLLTCREAIRRALDRVRQQAVETCWMDAGEVSAPEWPYCDDAPYSGGTVYESGFRAIIEAPPGAVWRPIVRLGGRTGWYGGRTWWRLRGMLDRLVGGVGMRRGRRDPSRLYVGDALDFWRVLRIEPERRLILVAEMKLPGEAVLEFGLRALPDGATELTQTARFLPRGLAGMAYWYALAPLHDHIFGGMLQGIAGAVGRPIRRGPQKFTPPIGPSCPAPSPRTRRESTPRAHGHQ